jgi:hypothetical protein
MIKLYLAWGFASVVTLALLGGALAYPDAYAPVADDQAAQLVGGQTTGCQCFQRVYCNQPPYCTAACFVIPADTSLCTVYGVGGNVCLCGPSTVCAPCYHNIGPCVVTTCPPPP